MLNTLSSRATFYDVIGYLIPGSLAIGVVLAWWCVFIDANVVMRLIRVSLQHSFLAVVCVSAIGYVLGHLMNSLSSFVLEKHLFANRFNNAKNWQSRLGADDRASHVKGNVLREYGVDIRSLTPFDIRIRMEEKMPNATITGFSFLSFYGMSRTLALLTWMMAIPVAELLRMFFNSWCAFAVAFAVVVLLGLLFVNQYIRFVKYYYDFLASTLMIGKAKESE